MRRAVVGVALVLLGAVSPAAGGAAVYEQPIFGSWDTAELDIVIVPPLHGPIFNDEGALNGADPMQATPMNAYLAATEDSIAAWMDAVREIGPRWLKAGLEFRVYVLGRDAPPQAALKDPEIVVVFDETKGPILGLAAWSQSECIVNNSEFFIKSYTYADMYNVNAQEFGHCLGLAHVTLNGEMPESGAPVIGHDVMNGYYADDVGGQGVHLHCVSNINVGGLEYVFAVALRGASVPKNPTRVSARGYRQVDCRPKPEP